MLQQNENNLFRDRQEIVRGLRFLRCEELTCDWLQHNKHSRHILGVHGNIISAVICHRMAVFTLEDEQIVWTNKLSGICPLYVLCCVFVYSVRRPKLGVNICINWLPIIVNLSVILGSQYSLINNLFRIIFHQM